MGWTPPGVWLKSVEVHLARLCKDRSEGSARRSLGRPYYFRVAQEELMQLKIGDLVVHPAFGIGHIVEVEEKLGKKPGLSHPAF